MRGSGARASRHPSFRQWLGLTMGDVTFRFDEALFHIELPEDDAD